MRCRSTRAWLKIQRDLNSELPQAQLVREHLRDCASCRAFELQQREVETILATQAPKAAPTRTASLSTDKVMRRIRQQHCATQQFEYILQLQQMRMARMRTVGAIGAALCFFTLSSIPLLFLAITIIQTDLALKTLALLNDFIDVLIVIGQFLQAGLILVSHDNWLLSGMAFLVVVMMGMWLRLMRPPQEA